MRMNSLKSLATNCGPLSEMMGRSPETALGPLDDRLHLEFFHGLADLPVDEPAVAVEDAAKEVERPADIDGGDIDVPMLMRPPPAARSPSPSWKAFPSAEGVCRPL